jgi:hypothetical protein
MGKQNDTISGDWLFHEKTDWYYVWGFTISWQNRLILCLGFHHFMTKHTDTTYMSGARPFHDKTDWYYVWGSTISWQTHWYYVWGFTISWQNRLILCLGIDHFITKQTDTMSGVRPFHGKTEWCYVWGSTISWQNRLMLHICLELDHFMKKQTDTMFGARPFPWNSQSPDIVSFCFPMKLSSPRHSISVLCHEMVEPQT